MKVMGVTSARWLSHGEQFGEASRDFGNHLADLMLWFPNVRE
jgi:hypothetical protein